MCFHSRCLFCPCEFTVWAKLGHFQGNLIKCHDPIYPFSTSGYICVDGKSKKSYKQFRQSKIVYRTILHNYVAAHSKGFILKDPKFKDYNFETSIENL